MGERVAVVVAERAFGGGANVGEDQGRGCLGGYPLQIYAVPGGNGRSEDAWLRAELGVGVVAYSKAITYTISRSWNGRKATQRTIVRSPSVKAETRIKGLCED